MKTEGKRLTVIAVSVPVVALAAGAALWFAHSSSAPGKGAPKVIGEPYARPSETPTPVPLQRYFNYPFKITFDLPPEWNVQETVLPDGRPRFKLTSPDTKINIESPIPTSKGDAAKLHVVQPLDDETFLVGGHEVKFKRFTNDYGQTAGTGTLRVSGKKDIGLMVSVMGNKAGDKEILASVLKSFAFMK